MSRAPVVRLCRGADCKERGRARRRLLDLLVGRAQVIPVRCQEICRGPVVGLEVGGELEWFESVRGDKARAALQRFLERGEMKGALKKRRVKKHSGRLR